MNVKDQTYWWGKAKEASAIIGWFPTVIFAQWQHETAHFTSSNFTKNNNIAGQTWQSYMPLSMKGTARPAAEGDYYIRYNDPVTGYVDFIQKNGRYEDVKQQGTEEEQIREIAACGWAVDTNYAMKLINRLNDNKQLGYALEEDPELDKDVANTIINTWIKPEWHEAEVKKIGALAETITELSKQQKYYNWLANRLRKASGQPEE
ncbi:hypothetical protein GC096_30720 [Paenibacillus sp. LMG 31461]|uniref:Mannosyl-glycoprotein endo-beta-N-acetylglucosamidase-like domain-containing protein n=1 Tax=Paenibacillus plantarum TaxID=2654975 RepID=A0ABX1XKN1_9BACL|nr:glucosaminidase domain-containing protein [Paenibacillus plantarum]NOU68404.1 hypothetical protein [Paenibacillus plantarum]